MALGGRLVWSLAVCGLAIAACGPSDNITLHLGTGIDGLIGHHGPDGTIAYEHLTKEDEPTFTGVIVPATCFVGSPADNSGSNRLMQQCKVENGVIKLCRQYSYPSNIDLQTIFGHKIDGLRISDIGAVHFVKLRIPAITFTGYSPPVDQVSSLSTEEKRTFNGVVSFLEEYEAFDYEIVNGVAVKVTISRYRGTKWPL